MSKEEIKLEDLELKYINPKGVVKLIKWGHDYKQWSCERRLEYAEALASAMNEAARIFQDERNETLELLDRYRRETEVAEQARDIAKKTLLQNITNSNAQQQDYINQLQALKAENKKLIEIVGQLNES